MRYAFKRWMRAWSILTAFARAVRDAMTVFSSSAIGFA